MPLLFLMFVFLVVLFQSIKVWSDFLMQYAYFVKTCTLFNTYFFFH